MCRTTSRLLVFAFAAVFAALVAPPSPTDLLALARKAVVAEVRGKAAPSPTTATVPKPVFVTLEIGGVIRGCRGSLDIRTNSLEREIVRASQAAARHDPRYRPLAAKELDRMVITVTIVDSRVPVTDVSGLQTEDGLVLLQGEKVGIVLPFEGRDPKTRLDWAYRKARARRDQPVTLEKLCARRYRE